MKDFGQKKPVTCEVRVADALMMIAMMRIMMMMMMTKIMMSMVLGLRKLMQLDADRLLTQTENDDGTDG